jgi:hypothetical protein
VRPVVNFLQEDLQKADAEDKKKGEVIYGPRMTEMIKKAAEFYNAMQQVYHPNNPQLIDADKKPALFFNLPRLVQGEVSGMIEEIIHDLPQNPEEAAARVLKNYNRVIQNMGLRIALAKERVFRKYLAQRMAQSSSELDDALNTLLGELPAQPKPPAVSAKIKAAAGAFRGRVDTFLFLSNSISG